MKAENVTRRVADAAVIIGLTVLMGWAFAWAKPAKRGFFCNDTAIQYPYREDTVTFRMVLVMVIPIPFIVLLFVELFSAFDAARLFNSKKSDVTLDHNGESSTFNVSEGTKMTSDVDWRRNTRRGSVVLRLCILALRNTGRIGLLFWFGLLVTMCITEVGKLGVGRLRPHFIDVCRPVGFNCSTGYVTEYECTGQTKLIWQARKSFPSGHASGTTYVALFLAIHLQRRMPVYRAMGLLLRPLLQAALLSAAFYTGLSRVHDYKHHPSDVFVGAIIGLVCAAWLMISVQKHVTYRKCSRNDVIIETSNNEVV